MSLAMSVSDIDPLDIWVFFRSLNVFSTQSMMNFIFFLARQCLDLMSRDGARVVRAWKNALTANFAQEKKWL